MKKIILILMALILLVPSAFAEDVWILCQPDSFVNTRTSANKNSSVNGRMECGWKAETNNKTRNGYIYIEDMSNEDGFGWISKGYVVNSKPIIITLHTSVYANGRVACWRSIGGTRRCWVNDSDQVTVYAVSKDWSVTNKGFIKTKYLGVDYELLARNLAKGFSDTRSTELYWDDD